MGYSEKYEQPVWVCYLLTADEVRNKTVSRTDDFRADPRIITGSAEPEDYSKSGYDRGHLAPAADMGWSRKTMSESFYMSNMMPQNQELNRGAWQNLESRVRECALKEGSVYVVTGPVFDSGKKHRVIGRNQVAVPDACYKVLYSPNGGGKMIGFVLPNKTVKNRSLADFACTVDEVEELTGLDFFSVLPEKEQERMESSFSLEAWPLEEDGSGNGI